MKLSNTERQKRRQVLTRLASGVMPYCVFNGVLCPVRLQQPMSGRKGAKRSFGRLPPRLGLGANPTKIPGR